MLNVGLRVLNVGLRVLNVGLRVLNARGEDVLNVGLF